jgi:hypothetical protein
MIWEYKPIVDNENWVSMENDVGWGGKKVTLEIPIFPRRCSSSKKLLWLIYAYKIKRTYYGFRGEVINETRWYDRGEYIKLRLIG